MVDNGRIGSPHTEGGTPLNLRGVKNLGVWSKAECPSRQTHKACNTHTKSNLKQNTECTITKLFTSPARNRWMNVSIRSNTKCPGSRSWQSLPKTSYRIHGMGTRSGMDWGGGGGATAHRGGKRQHTYAHRADRRLKGQSFNQSFLLSAILGDRTPKWPWPLALRMFMKAYRVTHCNEGQWLGPRDQKRMWIFGWNILTHLIAGVEFQWIEVPSHVNIPGNEQAAELAAPGRKSSPLYAAACRRIQPPGPCWSLFEYQSGKHTHVCR